MGQQQTDGNTDRSRDGSEIRPGRDRMLSAPVLRFDLHQELDQLRQSQSYESGKPAGTTLVKGPDLRIVLMTLRAGARLEKHRASGPISVQGLEGTLRLRLADTAVELTAGEMVALEAHISHDVEAMEDAAFLLTIGRTTYEQVSDRHEPRP